MNGDIAHVLVDDILVSGTTTEEHDKKLNEVMRRAEKINLKLNKKKLTVGVPEVAYAGHILSASGLKPDPAKVKAIHNMPSPTNKAQLKTLLGMLNYLSKFIPRLSAESAVLRELLKAEVEFTWGPAQENGFKNIKLLLSEETSLKYYDVTKSVTLQVDASKDGLGACLLQDGQPIAYASASLTETQQRYAQIEKEALAVVFGCKKFHHYIYGKMTNIHTDHPDRFARPTQARQHCTDFARLTIG